MMAPSTKGGPLDILAMIAGGMAGLGLSAWLGYLYGVRCRRLPENRYWIANGVGLAAGFLLATVGTQSGWSWLWVGGLAVMAGSLTGLKYGLGRSVGLWRLIDRPAGGSKRGGE